MERLSSISNFFVVLAAIVVLVLAFAVVRFVRSRRTDAPAPARSPDPSPAESDPDFIDSSHIGFAPLVSNVSLPPGGEGDAATRGNGS